VSTKGVVGDAEPSAVPVLERDPSAKVGVQYGEVCLVQRQPVLILLGRRSDHAEPQQRHFFFVCSFCERVSSTPRLRFSARFSLMDLPDFLLMVLRGDLSLMTDLSERKPERLRSRHYASPVRAVR